MIPRMARIGRVVGAVVLGISLTALGAAAQQAYLAFEQITVANTAIGFTAATIDGSGQQATVAMCRLRTAEVSYRIDGGTPTSSVGTLLEVGDTLTVTGHDVMAKFLAIRTTGTSGQLDCTYSAR